MLARAGWAAGNIDATLCARRQSWRRISPAMRKIWRRRWAFPQRMFPSRLPRRKSWASQAAARALPHTACACCAGYEGACGRSVKYARAVLFCGKTLLRGHIYGIICPFSECEPQAKYELSGVDTMFLSEHERWRKKCELEIWYSHNLKAAVCAAARVRCTRPRAGAQGFENIEPCKPQQVRFC